MITDPRMNALAEGLTGFSTRLRKGERVLIDAFDVPDAMVIALIRAARRRGALPFALVHHARVVRELMHGAVAAQYAPHTAVELARMKRMQAYIALRGSANIFETSDVPSASVKLVSRLMKPVQDHRVN
ncbi:MAG: aminopeptidase, partial [Opitutaceae bacterium]